MQIEDKLSFINESINEVYLHPVKLELVFSKDYQNVFELNSEKIIIDWSTTLDGNKIKSATGISKLTGYSSVRGGSCYDLKIPVDDFKYTIFNENGITIKDITEIVYRLKCSKYDWWYELFHGLENIKIENESINFEVSFGYGS